VKRPTMLYEALLQQWSIDLGLSVERDIEVIRRRCEHEGLSFLTITLPILSDSLEKGLEDGFLSCPSNFSRHGSLPRFLGGFFRNVFARSGELLPDACPDSVFAIREICRFFKKLKIACTSDREDQAIARYKEVEAELAVMTPQVMRKDVNLDKVARIIWTQVFPEFDPNDLVCRHGPGVTADRLLSNERFDVKQWYDRFEYCFPVDLHGFPNYGVALGEYDEGDSGQGLDGVEYYSIADEPSVRVVFVPKTLTTPRVIATEPASMQYVQQSLLNYIVPKLESHRLTARSVHFSDQTRNQRLAHEASIDRRLATLDLKDASDRVHFLLVRRIFEGSGILDYLEAARSLHATLPDGSNLVLNKFASMGSAICFPVEAMVFYTLIQTAIHIQDGVRPTSSSIRRYSSLIDVYGDDLIVPTRYADAVVRYLEAYALKVNVNKSFQNGFFRESCGGDYYKGISVKPVYARQLPHDDARAWRAEHVMAWVSTADQFYETGRWHIAQAIRAMLERVLRTPIPRSRYDGEGVFFKSLLFDTDLKYNRDLCGWKQRRIVYQPTKKKDDIDGNATACLNKVFTGSPVPCGPVYDRQSLSQDSPMQEYSDNHSYTLRHLCDGEDKAEWRLGLLEGLSPSNSILAGATRGERVEEGLPPPSSGYDGQRAQKAPAIPFLESGGRSASPRTSRVCQYSPRRNHLEIAKSPLDFGSSVKRGGFRPKRRWVSIPS